MIARRWSWIGAGVLLLADLFLHKPISDVCDAMVGRYGWRTFNHTALLVISGASLGIAGALLVWDWRRLRGPATAAALMILSLLTYLMHRWMLVANVELIHYPQYALIAAVLLFGGNTWNVAWLGATGAGVIDEVYQELVIYAGRPDTYLDFNDMVLNAIGATWAVLLLARWAGRSAPTTPTQRRASAVVLLLGFALALWLDPPNWTAVFRVTKTGGVYHVMSAAEGLAAALVLWLIARQGTAPANKS
ncbi:MAG TPA: hypothetical protein VL403_14025 [Candidatus Kryptonia bacterium]|nr:hypothetical protein [Candidatus Kryptonia bacterium]